jgi:isoquinoline 1-oxidoreductase alpha subunit
MTFMLKINGANRSVDVGGDTPLLWVLRAVHIDGTATRSCITSVDGVGKSAITTIEAVGSTAAGAKIQKAWLDREV